MKRFRFRLERLLELRAYREREWQAKLAQVMGLCLKLARQIKDNRREAKRSFAEDCPASVAKELDMQALQYREYYLRRLDQEHNFLETELEQRFKERNVVQEKFLDASKQRKVLDKLKERRQEEYYAEQKRELFKEQDEISVNQQARKTMRRE